MSTIDELIFLSVGATKNSTLRNQIAREYVGSTTLEYMIHEQLVKIEGSGPDVMITTLDRGRVLLEAMMKLPYPIPQDAWAMPK